MGRDIHMFIEFKESASSGWTFIGPYWYSSYSEAIVPMEVMSGRDYGMFEWLDSHADGILQADDLSEDIHTQYERWEYQWEIKWIDYKSLYKVSEMYDKIPDVVFKDLKPFDWDDDDWYDDDALNELSRFRREKMYLSSFISKISSYVDDLGLYMANSIRIVWWIDC